MAEFMIRFLIDNFCISGITGILLIIKRVLGNNLTSRMQYHLWFLLLGLLAVPFIPLRLIGFPQVFSWLVILRNVSTSGTGGATEGAINPDVSGTANPMNDFTLSVSREVPSTIGLILCVIWLAGIMAMIILVIRSQQRLNTLKKSALPLQNRDVRRLYSDCLDELHITADIPIYSTAFLKSPVIVGLFRPGIYIPIHLISDYQFKDMRYMILHELQHYKHKDALINHVMNLAGILYWFNPVVWYALKEMRNDKEVACDTSVLKVLGPDCYEDYGNTLINFAEKISLTPFPFAVGLSGSKKQIERRISNIASYEKPTLYKRLRGATVFLLTAVLLLGMAPFISTYAADGSRYQWKTSSSGSITYTDLSSYFGEYEGTFVLYDVGNDAWNVHNMDHAALRVAPNSTYKIYDALFGLEESIITPDASLIEWNNEIYPFEAWNGNQTLQSAMGNSVNWYFQALDQQLGVSALNSYIKRIGYGNEMISGELSSYWLESSLKISPIEQVELLTRFHDNSFDFAPENINAVKDAIRLSSSGAGTFYGKTGTGRIDGQDINGWFIGYIETADNTYFFATNIKADANAAGSNAAEITMSILSDMNIWIQ